MCAKCFGVYTILVLFLFAIPSQAAWTVEKDSKLLDLVTERVWVEQSLERMTAWGYETTDMAILTKLLGLLNDKQKQELLNSLIVDKVTYETVIKAKYETDAIAINTTNTELDKLKETP